MLGFSGSALAAIGHAPLCEVNIAEPCSFEGGGHPLGIAVDQSTHEVLVSDQLSGVVGRYSALGKLESQFTVSGAPSETLYQLAIGPEHDIYVVSDAGTVYKFNSAGTELSSIKAGLALPLGVAVDSHGNVYVSQLSGGTGMVDKYNSSGVPDPGNPLISGLAFPRGLAINSNGDIYVATGSGTIEFSEAGVEERQLNTGEAYGVTVDSSNNVFVDEVTSIAEYDESGKAIGSPFGKLATGFGVAVDDVSGDVYAAEYSSSAASNIPIFAPGETPGAPETEAATAVAGTTAVLHGTLKPPASKYFFEYGTGGTCVGERTPVKEGEGAVSAEVGGLQPSTPYRYCLVAENLFGVTPGNTETFTTTLAAPEVQSESSSAVSAGEATLQAEINPENQTTTCEFEYVDAEHYANEKWANPGKAKCEQTIEGPVPVTATATVKGLAEGTEYHFRVTATNGTGTSPERAGTIFTTKGAKAPEVRGESATGETQTTVALAAEVDPQDDPTACEFEYVTAGEFASTGYANANTIPCEPPTIVGEESFLPAHATLAGLAASTEYHWRVLASNAKAPGGVQGEDGTFTTRPSLPVPVTGAAGEVTPSSAKLEGTVNPGGATAIYDTRYYFEYGTSTGYGAFAPAPPPGTDAGSGTTPVPEHTNLTNLEPSTEYHYRLVAVNDNGLQVVDGIDRTFSTLARAPESLGPVTTTLNSVLLAMTATVTSETEYQIEYGTEKGVFTNTVAILPGEGKAGESEILTVQLVGLGSGTVYYYRLNATNGFSVTHGAEEEFKTYETVSNVEIPPGFSLVGVPLATPPATTFPDLTGLTPTPPKPPVSGPKPLTRVQRLANALRACRHEPRKRRAACVRRAHRRYGSKSKPRK